MEDQNIVSMEGPSSSAQRKKSGKADDVKKKWKNLRDSYNRELKKVEKPRSGSDADQNGFESRRFLKTILKPRKTTSNIQNKILDESDTMMSILSEQSSYNTQNDESQFNTDDTNLATILNTQGILVNPVYLRAILYNQEDTIQVKLHFDQDWFALPQRPKRYNPDLFDLNTLNAKRPTGGRFKPTRSGLVEIINTVIFR
ncbi:unnamed protein product [Colias eurytheme]|nr:unnamed protein product [Colias eurytheme]